MAMIFTQTDTNSGLTAGRFCRSGDSNYDPANAYGFKTAGEGSSAGSTPVTVTLLSSAVDAIFYWELDVPTGASWDAGDWTVRVNATTANMNLSGGTIAICRVNSSGVAQEQLAFASTGFSFSTTGVKTLVLAGSAATPNAGDKVVVILTTANGAMSTQSAAITPDQDIDSPFTEAVLPQIDAQPGSFSNTGVAATLLAGRNINAAPGSYSLTGVDATLAKGYQTSGETGSYSLTGVDATFLKNSVVSGETGSFSLTGTDATLAAGKTFNAEPGAFSIAGVDATFALGYAMNAETGAYVITGIDAGTISERNINAETGAYSLTGVDATLEYTPVGAYTLDAQPGSFAVTGVAANLTAERMLSADSGIYVVSGVDATLDYSGGVAPAPEPGVSETPAGRSRRRREHFIARYKGQEYEFHGIDQLQEFVASIKPDDQRRRGKKQKVTISVPKEVRKEFIALDLPSIETPLMRFDWTTAEKLWERYQLLRRHNPIRHETERRTALMRQIEREDEELMLL